jgi:hypothetical protein
MTTERKYRELKWPEQPNADKGDQYHCAICCDWHDTWKHKGITCPTMAEEYRRPLTPEANETKGSGE